METKPLLLYFVQCTYIVRKFYGAEYPGSGPADNLNPDLTLSYRLSLPPLWPKIPVISWRSDIGRGDEWVTTTYSYSKLSMVKHSWGPREQPLSLLDRVPIRRTLTVLNHLCFLRECRPRFDGYAWPDSGEQLALMTTDERGKFDRTLLGQPWYFWTQKPRLCRQKGVQYPIALIERIHKYIYLKTARRPTSIRRRCEITYVCERTLSINCLQKIKRQNWETRSHMLARTTL